MRSKLKMFVLFFVIAGVIVGTVLSRGAEATVPGTNIAMNYDYTNTSIIPQNSNDIMHLSEDSKVVAWYSKSRNVVSGDTGSGNGMYVKNMQTGATSIADLDLAGNHGWVADTRYAFSRSGRYVAFSSFGTNMVSTPTVPSSPAQAHVYIRDMQLGTTTLVDQTSSGVLANVGANTGKPFVSSVSDDGRFVSFFSQANNLLGADNPASPSYGTYYIKDMRTGQIISPDVVSPGTRANSGAIDMKAACDGSLVIFSSNATNRTAYDNGKYNIYLMDLRNGYTVTNLTYGANNGARVVSISCNGLYVVLDSTATNLTSDTVSGSNTHWFRYDRLTNTYKIVDKATSGYISSSYSPTGGGATGGMIVGDNGLVAFRYWAKDLVSPSALNFNEVYLSNPDTGTTELVPINSSGVEENASSGWLTNLEINARGDSVIYDSAAINLVPGITSSTGLIVLSKVQ